MAEGGQNSPRCRKLSTAGWYYAPRGFDAGSSLGPLRKGRGSALAHQASSGEQAGRPRPRSRAPSCRSVTPAALARVARGSTRHCVSARLPPRGGGAGGRERGREDAPRRQCPDGSLRVWVTGGRGRSPSRSRSSLGPLASAWDFPLLTAAPSWPPAVPGPECLPRDAYSCRRITFGKV